MSFAGGSTKSMPALPQKPLGVEETRASTNEQARPVPYMAGKTRVGVTWLDNAFDTRADAVVSSSGKGQSSVRGYNYYASLVALVCHGPVDAIEAIYFNGDKVWEGSLSRDLDGTPVEVEEGEEPEVIPDDYVDIEIESHGMMRLFWGTDTQGAIDEEGEEVTEENGYSLVNSGHYHPAYRRQCYVVFKEIYFGFNQTNAPNVEFVITRHPHYDWLGATEDVEGDCNPVAVIAEWLQNKVYGLGWPEAWLDTTSLAAVATQLKTEKIGISPHITKQTSARQLITQVCEYIDGYALTTPEGKFKLGLIRKPADVEALPLINETHLLEEPELNPSGWQGVKTKTWIKFNDRTRAYQENSFPYRDAGAAALGLENSQQTIERPWVTRPDLAQAMVAATGRALALPETEGELLVRKSAALKPGDLFRLTYAHLGISEMVMRVISANTGKPGSRSVSLNVTLDRSYLNEKYYIPDADELTEPEKVEPEPFEHQLMLEAPIGLQDGDKPSVLPLVARKNLLTTLYDIHLRRTRDLYGTSLGRVYSVPTYGYVEAPYNYPALIDETAEGILVSYLHVGVGSTLQSLAAAAKLVLFIAGEYMVVLKWTPTTGPSPRYYARCQVIRKRYNVYYRNYYGYQGIPHGTMVTYVQSSYPLYQVTYDELEATGAFAVCGTVAEEYPRATRIIDNNKGMLVNIISRDKRLVSPSLGNALKKQLLVFAGNEILSVARVSLTGTNQYRLYGLRACFDTRRLAHPVSEKV
ncbi:MAG: hypothetical protein K0Q55_2661, partial [Verrucomicrobia bacterium]|nr:hypothetical protein [Verrucomicrobiota bacterium]